MLGVKVWKVRTYDKYGERYCGTVFYIGGVYNINLKLNIVMIPEDDNLQEPGDRAEANRLKNIPDQDTNPGEAQNVTDGTERLSGEEAEKARNKAMEGINQGRGS